MALTDIVSILKSVTPSNIIPVLFIKVFNCGTYYLRLQLIVKLCLNLRPHLRSLKSQLMWPRILFDNYLVLFLLPTVLNLCYDVLYTYITIT